MSKPQKITKLSAFPGALITAQAALAAIETFEIVGENNDSREPNAEDRFILTKFIAHAFGGYPIEQPAAAPIDERAIAARTDSAGVSEIILSTIVRAARKGKSYVEGYGKAHQFLKDAGLLVDGSAATAPAPSPADERAAFEIVGATVALQECVDAAEAWHVISDAEDADDIDPVERTMAAGRRVAAFAAARKLLEARAASANETGAEGTIDVPIELSSVAETLAEGGGFWRSCSGCHETNEGHETGHYPYSKILKCHLGGGCSECGGIGAVWDDTDYEAMGRDFERSLVAPTRSPAMAAEAVASPAAGEVYQVKLPGDSESTWRDATESAYAVTTETHRRIVYRVPQPAQAGAREGTERKIADVVNSLRDIAILFRDAQQLRERIAGVVVPLLSGRPDQQEPSLPTLVPCPVCGGEAVGHIDMLERVTISPGRSVVVADDPIAALLALHAEVLEQNDYAYFELARTRRTDWMAWICSNHSEADPNRKVLAKGQGGTPRAACAAALKSFRAGGE